MPGVVTYIIMYVILSGQPAMPAGHVHGTFATEQECEAAEITFRAQLEATPGVTVVEMHCQEMKH